MSQRHHDALPISPGVFGKVASDSTRWRVLHAVTDADLVAIDTARAAAREVVWAQRAEVTGVARIASGRDARPVLVIDEDATLVIVLHRPRP